MPSGHQSVDMLIKGRYFDSNHSNNIDGRNDDDDDGDDGDLRDVTNWPPLMKGEFTLSNNIAMYHLYHHHHHHHCS